MGHLRRFRHIQLGRWSSVQGAWAVVDACFSSIVRSVSTRPVARRLLRTAQRLEVADSTAYIPPGWGVEMTSAAIRVCPGWQFPRSDPHSSGHALVWIQAPRVS